MIAIIVCYLLLFVLNHVKNVSGDQCMRGGPAVVLRNIAQVGSLLSVSVVDFIHFGRPLALRGMMRLGSSLSIIDLPYLGENAFSLFVLLKLLTAVLVCCCFVYVLLCLYVLPFIVSLLAGRGY